MNRTFIVLSSAVLLGLAPAVLAHPFGHAHDVKIAAALSMLQIGLGLALISLVLLFLGASAGNRLDRAGTPKQSSRRFRGLQVMHAVGVMIALAGGYLVISG